MDGPDSSEHALLAIHRVNSMDGFTPYLIGFYIETEHGWVGAYDKRALELALAAARKAGLEEALTLVEPTTDHRKEASWAYIGGEEGVELLDIAANKIRALTEGRDG